MTTERKTRSEQYRELYAAGIGPCEVARRVGGKSGAVCAAVKRTGKRGRPRKTPCRVEQTVGAIARMLEEKFGYVGLAEQVRNGEWREFL